MIARDFMLRAPSRDAFETAAESYGLLIRDADGNQRPAPGVHIDHIGPVIVTPAIHSEDGQTMVTPPVLDQRHHVNLRITEPALSVTDEQGTNKVDKLVAMWAAGNPGENNAGETSSEVGAIEWVRDVASPTRVWA